jgi:pimeloyl-ACP methyl ester carboxylesterase
MRRLGWMIATFYLIFLGTVRPLCAADEPKPLGKLVDIGGHRLHVYCTGKGGPTVVVETGLGDFSFGWILVQSRVEKFARICTYDRAGYAWSDPGPKPRTYAQLNLELHGALAKLGERGPFVLVGHSFGGPVVRNFALTYPAEVAGMVLVDTVHEEQRIIMGGKHVARIRDGAKGTPIPPPHANMVASDRPNVPPWPKIAPDAKVDEPFDKLPVKYQRLQLWAEASPALDDAENSQKQWSGEYLAKWHASSQEGSLGTIPLLVLTRADGGYDTDLDVPAEQLESERKRLQADLAKLSKNGKQVIVASGHNMHLEAPQAVADAIRSVIEKCRPQDNTVKH